MGAGSTHRKELRAACGHGSTVIGRQCWRSQRDDLDGKGGLGRGLIIKENYIQIAECGMYLKERYMLGMYRGFYEATSEETPILSLIIDFLSCFRGEVAYYFVSIGSRIVGPAGLK